MNQKHPPHLDELTPSSTLAINEYSLGIEAQGRTIYHFGFGQSPFPIPKIITAALQEHAPRKEYLPEEGLEELHQAVANSHHKVDNVPIKSNQVFIGPGSKELIFILQLALTGSTLIPAPSWISYAHQCPILKRKIKFIQTQFNNNWRLFPDQFQSAIHKSPGPHLLILNYPGIRMAGLTLLTN